MNTERSYRTRNTPIAYTPIRLGNTTSRCRTRNTPITYTNTRLGDEISNSNTRRRSQEQSESI